MGSAGEHKGNKLILQRIVNRLLKAGNMRFGEDAQRIYREDVIMYMEDDLQGKPQIMRLDTTLEKFFVSKIDDMWRDINVVKANLLDLIDAKEFLRASKVEALLRAYMARTTNDKMKNYIQHVLMDFTSRVSGMILHCIKYRDCNLPSDLFVAALGTVWSYDRYIQEVEEIARQEK